MRLDAAPSTYAWSVPPPAGDLVLLDLDGTLRGDVVPMVKLVAPLLPSFLEASGRAPAGAKKLGRFLWSLGRLWTLRVSHADERRRYKRLFSELHILAGAMLDGEPIGRVRAKYRRGLAELGDLWEDAAVELLRRVCAGSRGLIVTGSEQLQTEECVRRLAARGVDVGRLGVRGSLYGHDPACGVFDGGVDRLLVTFEGKEEAVEDLVGSPDHRVVAAFGNSRPDRALFEAVEEDGLRVLVCPRRIVRERRADGRVLRRLAQAGFAVRWSADEYLTALDAGAERPLLATDARLEEVLERPALAARYPELLGGAPARLPVP